MVFEFKSDLLQIKSMRLSNKLVWVIGKTAQFFLMN